MRGYIIGTSIELLSCLNTHSWFDGLLTKCIKRCNISIIFSLMTSLKPFLKSEKHNLDMIISKIPASLRKHWKTFFLPKGLKISGFEVWYIYTKQRELAPTYCGIEAMKGPQIFFVYLNKNTVKVFWLVITPRQIQVSSERTYLDCFLSHRIQVYQNCKLLMTTVSCKKSSFRLHDKFEHKKNPAILDFDIVLLKHYWNSSTIFLLFGQTERLTRPALSVSKRSKQQTFLELHSGCLN